MTTPPAELEPRKSYGSWRTWLIVAIVVYAALFIALNSKSVRIRFVLFTAETSLLIALLLAGALGFLVGWLLGRRRPTP